MKHRNLSVLLFFVTILLLFACNPQREARDLLRQAQALVDTQPEVALHLIDSIFYPEQSLNKREYMSYLVTRVQVRYRDYSPIDADTVIFVARDYFAKYNQDARQTALAYFYSGCVYLEQEDFENAMEQYKHAAKYAMKTNDADLQGLIQYNIGDLLRDATLYTEALEQYKIAERFFANSLLDNATEKQASSFIAIGLMHSYLRQPDSTFIAYYKGLELAKNSGNSELARHLMQNISATYTRAGEYEKAEGYLRQSFTLNNDTANLSRYYLSFAKLFMSTKQSDSLAVYVDKLKQVVEQSDDLYFKVGTYHFLAANAKINNDFGAAFVYQDEEMGLAERMTRRRLEQSVYEVQQRYNFEVLQHRYNQQLITRLYWIIFLLLTVIVVAVLFAAYRIIQRKRREEALRKIETLEDMNRDLEFTIQDINTQKRADMRNEFLWRFNVAEKAVEINKAKEETDKKLALGTLNNILYGSQNIDERWKPLFQFFNEERPGLYEKIKNKYSLLTETELRICILSYGNLSVRKIAFILEQKEETIQVRRSELRKKIGLPQDMKIPDFLDNIYFSGE
jgi:tetratricopeptide (TPR) repeat protein